MLVGLKRISAALGLLAATAATPSVAQDVAATPSPNQATANAVAASLRSSAALSGYRIEIETRDGQVTLTGAVSTPAQRAEAINRSLKVAGVSTVVDRLQVSGDSRVQHAQYVAGGGLFRRGGIYGAEGGIGEGPIASNVGGGMGAMPTQPVAPAGPADGPIPEGPAGMVGATQASMPGYPNYAWPSYAPYPNFSAVGYPTAYPWQAWPNIGPIYPYPEVPLDWRAVTLRWDDGIWWLDFKKHYTRPFFTPYPFGIMAY
jgi:BON domain-containing protein